MPDANHIARPTQYASHADFQRIFEEEMSDLYLLSFLLTADRDKAEQCFVSGLEDAVEGNHVFKEWARSWARRVIIQNAVRVINPQPASRGSRQSPAAVSGNGTTLSDEQAFEIAAVLRLEPFERFVYAILPSYWVARGVTCSPPESGLCNRPAPRASRATPRFRMRAQRLQERASPGVLCFNCWLDQGWRPRRKQFSPDLGDQGKAETYVYQEQPQRRA
jgi:hypothetical protein